MICHDAREQFSALLDERLTREERADVYGHLATCADCRRELESIERTVALVRGAPPLRAPAGFVDRVVAAARPPWYRRAARAARLPWPVKVPLSAAALLLVAGLAALLVRGVEEPDRAVVSTPAAPSVGERRGADEPPAAERAPKNAATEADARVAPSGDGRVPAAPAAPPPTAVPDERRDAVPSPRREAAGTTLSLAAAPDVVARLSVPEPGAAERGLAALAARLAGEQTGRRIDGHELVVDLVIPRERYDDFQREAARFGDYRTESEAGDLPETIRIAVRLGS